jgi:sec-independent protein translocase protein TatA
MLAELFGADLVIVIIVVAILLIGGTQIPKLARSLGSAKNQFEQGLKEGKVESAASNGTSAAADTPAPPAQSQAPPAPPAQAPAPPAEGSTQTG